MARLQVGWVDGWAGVGWLDGLNCWLGGGELD